MSADFAPNCTNPNTTVIWPDYGPIKCSLFLFPKTCTLDTCPISFRQINYVPSLAGNALYLAIFCLALAIQLFLGVRHRTWGYLGGMFGGLGLEILGYISRVMLHNNIFDDNWFKIYLVGLTIAPAFLSGSIYICLSRIIVVYGRSIARFRPAFYTITFICFDVFSLILQAAGGAIAASSTQKNQKQVGINLMIAGLAFQVVSLFCFLTLCADFGYSVCRNKANLDPTWAGLRSTFKFKAFLWALFGAVIFIFVRSCFRVAELKAGFNGALANNEVLFMILEGAMVVSAVILLTVLHPGIAFQGHWQETNFSLRASKDRLRTQGGSDGKELSSLNGDATDSNVA